MKILTCLMCCSLGVTALAEESAGTSPLEHEREVYGRVFDRIVSRCRIWPGLAPNETSDDPGRYAFDGRGRVWRRYDVSAPELVLLKPREVKFDTLVLVMAGGGYKTQNFGFIGPNVQPILESGRWVAVLNYRIPRREGRPIYAAAREDATRAIRWLKGHAGEFGYSPKKIGSLGFSAGGQLSVLLAVSSQDASYDRVDSLDDIPANLAFAVAVYPAYVLDDGETGPNVRNGDDAELLPEFKFDKKTPPMFLLHGDLDNYSPMGSLLIYRELHRRKIPAQLFVYARAYHGLCNRVNVRGWEQRIIDWMDGLGF